MAVEEKIVEISLEAGQDLSAKQYFLVAVASDGQVDPAGDGGNAIGVLTNKPAAAGRAASIAIGGRVKVIAGATVAAGDAMASDAAGEAVTAASGDQILGTFLEGGDNGEIVSAVWQPRGIQA